MNHQAIKDILQPLVAFFGFEVTDIRITDEGDLMRVEMVSVHASRIIGWHGETLNALQSLLKAIIRSKENLERSPFIVLDVDGYRRMQEDKVRRIAEQKADFVRRTGNRIALAPMSPYFRRIVHLHVANTPALGDLTTESVGEGEYRQVVMRLKEARGGEELQPVISQGDGLENLDV
ncbi:MAG: spoIIIJ-associated protein [Candidatus Peregrinibacteria bacterium Greene0416_19]|nr:MAG: spoIIIJ-associated protein [Candidatus Peregrinibacteria bacterium Greene0416_19]